MMEGDTPAFLNLINNGLSVPEQPNWGDGVAGMNFIRLIKSGGF